MNERSDLYIAFYEKSLSLLKNNGVLSFVCTDRWTKNRYGASLRNLIFNTYQLDLFIDMYGQNAFQSGVLTYPAITQISKRSNDQTLIIHNPEINEYFTRQVIAYLRDNNSKIQGAVVRKDVVNSDKPWIFGTSDELDLINRLESEFPLIEEAGCKVFIGAATGNNNIYIVNDDLDIEPCRKIPMVKAGDIKGAHHSDSQQFIINTYDSDGVIDLENYPKLKEYLEQNSNVLKSRHVAKKQPDAWFKTIDRIYPDRANREKLLIPDIKSQLTVVYSEGFHPNNSIYYVCDLAPL